MSKSSNVFNLVDGLLPQVAAIDIRQPGLLQMLYAGIGMPSLRIEEMATQGCVTYCQIKAGNRLRSLYDPHALRQHYEVLRAQAVAGDADALNDLGWLWLNGSRVEADPQLAQQLFRIAAMQGSAEALFNQAEQHAYGKGVVVDLHLASEYYELAFQQGVRCAAQALGGLYENGDEGFAADHAKALAWYRRGADEQDPMACYLLGRLALDELSSVFDPPLGLYWLQWAAMRGEVLASERLASFYYDSFDTPPDPDGLLHGFWRGVAIQQGSTWV